MSNILIAVIATRLSPTKTQILECVWTFSKIYTTIVVNVYRYVYYALERKPTFDDTFGKHVSIRNNDTGFFFYL